MVVVSISRICSQMWHEQSSAARVRTSYTSTIPPVSPREGCAFRAAELLVELAQCAMALHTLGNQAGAPIRDER
jgi:hypothetical protein